MQQHDIVIIYFYLLISHAIPRRQQLVQYEKCIAGAGLLHPDLAHFSKYTHTHITQSK